MKPLVLVIAAAVALVGCNKGESLDCEVVVNHYMSKVEALLDRENESAETKKLASMGLPGLREKLIAACQEQEWSKQGRECILRAEAAEDLEQCNPIVDPE